MAHQVKLRPLLPLPANRPNQPEPAPLPKRKRPQVTAACNGCRGRKVKVSQLSHSPHNSPSGDHAARASTKTKGEKEKTDRDKQCDGVRPSCYSCSASKIPCVYPVPEGLSQREAQKQKLSDVSRAQENSHTVLQLLRASREGFSREILQQLRQSEHLDDAIQAIAEASLLLPQGDDHAQTSQACQVGNDREPRGQSRAGNHDVPDRSHPAENADPGTTTTLPLSRWTTVSDDDTLLTRLFDLFWVWESALSPLVDRELLTAQLKTSGPAEQQRFCSPLLVNAIFAVSSLHSDSEYSTSKDDAPSLARRFADYAFDLIEAESVGSLTLMQSAAVLWVYARNDGSRTSQDRAVRLAGLMRQVWPALVDSLDQQTAHDSRLRQAISQISWGFYCFFAKMALTFSPQTLVSKPLIVKTFEAQDGAAPGSPVSAITATSSSAVKDPTVAQEACKLQLLAAECSLCEIIDQLVSGFASGASHRVVLDSAHCTALYNKLLCWKLALPENLATTDSGLPPVLHLQTTYDFVALKLLTTFAGTDFDGRHADSLILLHAGSIVASLWIHRGLYGPRHGYWAAEYCALAARTLLPRLDSAHDVFARACRVLHEMGRVSGRAAQLLGEVEAAARGMGVRIPAYGRGSSRSLDVDEGIVVVEGAKVFDGSGTKDGCEVRFGERICDVRRVSGDEWFRIGGDF